jgi:hypothetical protein
MTKTLIIPDIHTKFGLAEEIIEKEKCDEVVFLGDYFDNWDDNYEIAHQTAEWLKESMKQDNRIHLIGNHDLSYSDPKRHMCSGFEELKKHAIDKVGIDWEQLWRWVWVDDWLCTHAGLSNEFYKMYAKDGEYIQNFLARMYGTKETEQTLYSVSSFRSNNGDPSAGIVWCDWKEFINIPNVKQIFGHTVGDIVRHEKNNYCIDTALNNYAIYDHKTEKMQIKDTPNELLFTDGD